MVRVNDANDVNGSAPEVDEAVEKTRRVYCRIPEATYQEIEGYIEKSGLLRPNFLAIAFVYGARALARQLDPSEMIRLTVEAQTKTMLADPELREMFIGQVEKAGEFIQEE